MLLQFTRHVQKSLNLQINFVNQLFCHQSPQQHQLQTRTGLVPTVGPTGPYLARVGAWGTSAGLWLTDAPFPRTRWVSSGWRSSCESGCHGGSGRSEIQNHRCRLAACRCLPCCRTRRVTSRWSPWKLGSDSGWPSRTALRSSALMTRLSHAVCSSRCSHYLRTWKDK